MAGQIETIEEIPVDVSKAVFFENEKNIGFDPITNDPIFSGSRPMAKFRPKIDPATGKRETRKGMNGYDLGIGVNEFDGLYDQCFIYKKVRVKSGGVIREACEHPDALWARYKGDADRARAEARGKDLLAELGASGLSADDIVRGIQAAKAGAIPPAVRTVTEASGVPAVPQTVTAADPNDGFPEMYMPGKFYLSAQHKAAVQAGEQKPYTGTQAQADDAALIQWDIEAETAAQSAAVPSF